MTLTGPDASIGISLDIGIRKVRYLMRTKLDKFRGKHRLVDCEPFDRYLEATCIPIA